MHRPPLREGIVSGKRRFGTVRRLTSGRWQIRYTAEDGIRRLAPTTFDTKKDADRWLVATEADMMRGDWLDPDAGKVSLKEFADRWVKERDLKARTREEYERHLRLHVLGQLGKRPLGEINPGHVRTWRNALLAAGVGQSTVAKTYRILHAIFATAVDDDLIRRNPCRIKGAGQDKTEERPTDRDPGPGLRHRRGDPTAIPAPGPLGGIRTTAVRRAGRATPPQPGPDRR